MQRTTCPDWYPLPVHLSQPESYAHWIRAITTRLGVTRAPQSSEWKKAAYLEVVIPDDGKDWTEPDPVKYSSIQEITPYEAFKLAQLHDTPENAEAKRVAQLQGPEAYTEESLRVKTRKTEVDTQDGWWDEFQYRMPVMIDLAQDDKTITANFKFWLFLMRALIKDAGVSGMASPIAITHENLQRWHDARLLAAFDLVTWREISGAGYSDAAIASWLWPDSGPLSDGTLVDRAERFRKVTRPLMDKVFDWHTVGRLEKAWAWDLFRTSIALERNEEA